MKLNHISLSLTLLIIAVVGCNNNQSIEEIAPLFPQPQVVKLNTDKGYLINQVTGDSVPTITNAYGDTLKTGISVPAKGKIIHPDSVAEPKSYPATAFEKLISRNAHPNVHKVPDNLLEIPVQQETLTKILLEEIPENDTIHYVKGNSTGIKIKTGVPIYTKGKSVESAQPQQKPALPLRFKDNVNCNMQYIDVDQGLAVSYTRTIIEDSKGNIWIGNEDGGVSRYNGVTFVHFTEKEGLSNNTVLSILEDSKGNLWFGTYGGGVNMYNGETFVHFTEEEGLSDNTILTILEDSDGNIWFGTLLGGVSKYNGEYLVNITVKEGLNKYGISSIIQDKNGDMWFGSLGGGLIKFNGESFVHYTNKDGLSNNRVQAILEDSKGNLWISTWGGGVNKFNGTSFTHFTVNEGLSHNIVKPILEDYQGNIWFGTAGGGLNMYNGESIVHFTEEDGLSNNMVNSIMEDNSGNLWLSTWGGGLSKYNGQSFVHFTEEEGLTANTVRSIVEDRNGNFWFGTDRAGVNIYNEKSIVQLTVNEGLNFNQINTTLEDSKGNFWFGTDGGGLSMYNGESFFYFNEKEGLTNNYVTSIIEDSKGNIWIGTNGGGLYKYNGEFFVHFSSKEGLSSINVFSIIEDKKGNIWLGTVGGGISKYDGESFVHYTEKEGLSTYEVYSLFEDKNGNIWIITYGAGLSMFNGESFVHFTEKEGLNSNYVWSIIEDNQGLIWVGTENGINSIEIGNVDGADTKSEHYNKKFIIKTYGKNDGLKGTSFFVNSALKDSKNRLWWGNNKSLTMLDMNKFRPATKAPSILLKQLDIDEQFIDYRNISENLRNDIVFSSVQPFENYPLQLKLPYNKNHLTFHFAGIDWSAPHQIQYSYLMQGLNTTWSKPSTETKADFRKLPYGEYSFKIRAIGASGDWSEPFEYSFTINPPWWHTWWARIIYGLLLIISVWAIVQWRTASLKRRQKELEHEVDLATEEIREQKQQVEKEKERSEELLLNILPEEVAEELKLKGETEAVHIDQVSVLFTDFKGFTALSEQVTPKELVADLHACFSAFDRICQTYGIEKIKTIGDAYMAAGGLPSPNSTHATDVVKAALEMAEVVEKGKAEKIAAGLHYFEIRIGIHTGPVVAGIVGVKKFQYDIWGDTVNTASRMESNGEVSKVNISQTTYDLLKEDADFTFESRGKVAAKGKGEIEMYFVSRSFSEG